MLDVLEPGLELPNHENGGQQIQVPAHGGVGDAERPPELGAVPELSVPVREHRPEAAQGCLGDGAPEARQVTREKRLYKTVAPSAARGARRCQIRSREAAAQPETLQVIHLGHVETVELVERDAAGERLGGLPQQVGRGAPEDQEAGRRPGAIGKHTQQLEDAGQPVDLIQDHQAAKGPELESGIFQPGKIDGVFEIEPGHGVAVHRRQLAGEGGLADLARTQQRDDGELVQQESDSGEVVLPGNLHHCNMSGYRSDFKFPSRANLPGSSPEWLEATRLVPMRSCRYEYCNHVIMTVAIVSINGYHGWIDHAHPRKPRPVR